MMEAVLQSLPKLPARKRLHILTPRKSTARGTKLPKAAHIMISVRRGSQYSQYHFLFPFAVLLS